MEILCTVLRIVCIILTLSEYAGVTAVYFTSPSHDQHENQFLNSKTFERTRPPLQYVPTIPRQRIDKEISNIIHHFGRSSHEFTATTSFPGTVPYTNIYAKWTTNLGKTMKFDTKNTTPYWLPGLDIRLFQKTNSVTTSIYKKDLNTSRIIEEHVKTQPIDVENVIDEQSVDRLPENFGNTQKRNSRTNLDYNDQLKELRIRMKNSSTNKEIVKEDSTLQRDSDISQNEKIVTTEENGEVIEIETRMNDFSTQSTETVGDDQEDCMRKVVGLLLKRNDARGWEQATHSLDPIFRRNYEEGNATLNNGVRNDEIQRKNSEKPLNSSNCVDLRRSQQDADSSDSNPVGGTTDRLQCYSCTNDTNVNCNEAGLFTLKKYCDSHEVCLKVVTKNVLTCRTSLERSCARSDACTNRHELPATERVACVICEDSLCNAGLSTFTIVTSFSALLVAVFVILANIM